jgi:hypothetical protein
MVDEVNIDRQPLALGEQLGYQDRRDGRRRDLAARSLALPESRITRRMMIVFHTCCFTPAIAPAGSAGL